MRSLGILLNDSALVLCFQIMGGLQTVYSEDSISHIPVVELLLLFSSSQTPPLPLSISHDIPLTYPGFDPQFRQLKVVKTDQDPYWMGLAEIYSYNPYGMLTDHLGHVLIPPFVLTELRSVSSTDSDYDFALIPLHEGGLQVLAPTRKAADASYSDPSLFGKRYPDLGLPRQLLALSL